MSLAPRWGLMISIAITMRMKWLRYGTFIRTTAGIAGKVLSNKMDDYTDHYNTPLQPHEEQAFQQWLGANSSPKRDMSRDLYDYDLRGYWKANGGQPIGTGHMTDQFKKPNHPTFSTESQYHGQNGQQGGAWIDNGDKTWSFKPGATNLQHYGPQGLQDYFMRAEPGNKLLLNEVQE